MQAKKGISIYMHVTILLQYGTQHDTFYYCTGETAIVWLDAFHTERDNDAFLSASQSFQTLSFLIFKRTLPFRNCPTLGKLSKFWLFTGL